MIRCRPMGYFHWPSHYGSWGAKDAEFVRCVEVQEPQIHDLWCLGLDNITLRVHLTSRLKVVARTVGEFTINCLAENGRRIPIIGQLCTNESV